LKNLTFLNYASKLFLLLSKILKMDNKMAKQAAKNCGLLGFVKRESGLNIICLLKYAQSRKTNSKSKIIKAGFTLVELAIVLVIIGLVVGGVLVGQDLIKTSEIRAQVSQITKYNSAVHTFQTKYNGIPGDLLSTEASAFGLFASTSGPTVGYGDGNGSITSDNVSGTPYCRGEPIIFWRHLSDAKLIDGSYSTTTGVAAGNINSAGWVAVIPTTVDMINAHLPKAKIGNGASIMVGAYNNGIVGAAGSPNYYVIAGINAMSSTAGYFTGSTNPLTAQESYNIDNKIDDGKPLTGSVTAGGSAANFHPLPGSLLLPLASCVSSSAYVLSATTQSCSLQFKFQ
jgi:prepilin-type N-terminal cleavage/methylation domain-containing protein